MPMSAAEERRLRRQHRILANSEQRMKLVMGEATSGGSEGGNRVPDNVNQPEAGTEPDEEQVSPPQDKDRELEDIAKELEELRKKDLSGTFRGEGGSASFGGGRGGGGGTNAAASIFERLLNDPAAREEVEVDATTRIAKFMMNTFPWIVAGLLVPNATIYVALAAIAGFYLQTAVLGGNTSRPVWSALLTLAGVSEQGKYFFISYVLLKRTTYLVFSL